MKLYVFVFICLEVVAFQYLAGETVSNYIAVFQ